MKELEDRILDAVRKEPLDPSELASTLHADPDVLGDALRSLLDADRVHINSNWKLNPVS